MTYLEQLEVLKATDPFLGEQVTCLRNLEAILKWGPEAGIAFAGIDLVQQDEYILCRWRNVALALTPNPSPRARGGAGFTPPLPRGEGMRGEGQCLIPRRLGPQADSG